jgi:tetratricopeptide (TPR) repeat protein
MNLNEYKSAIPDLMAVSTDFPLYKKKLYIALAMCFANLNDFESGIRHLSRGLLKFPKFTEGFVARGQFYAQQMRWDKAVQDFYKAISLNPAQGSAYVGLGGCVFGI